MERWQVLLRMKAESNLAHGWVNEPNGRGTFEILQSCLVTTFLCSWSALFLNVPAERIRSRDFAIHKGRWMVFAIAFPEVLTRMAAEQ